MFRLSTLMVSVDSMSRLKAFCCLAIVLIVFTLHKPPFILLNVQDPKPVDRNNCVVSRKMLWFVGAGSNSQSSDDEYFRYIRVAVNSARANAPSLIPVLLYSHISRLPLDIISDPDLIRIQHNLTFSNQIGMRGCMANEGPGVYFRLDIPTIVDRMLPTLNSSLVDTEYVLYTDADVLFLNDVNECNLMKPKVIMVGPEHVKDTIANTGVMYINVSSFEDNLPELLDYANASNWNGCGQDLVLSFFRNASRNLSMDLLPNTFNWKGYWGHSSAAAIVHFHGPKPLRCLPCYLAEKDITACNCPRGYDHLFKSFSRSAPVYYKLLMDHFTAFDVNLVQPSNILLTSAFSG